jgi:hypothetical protein
MGAMTTDDEATGLETPESQRLDREDKPPPSGIDRRRILRTTTVGVATMLLASVVFYLLVSRRH